MPYQQRKKILSDKVNDIYYMRGSQFSWVTTFAVREEKCQLLLPMVPAAYGPSMKLNGDKAQNFHPAFLCL